MSELTAKQSRFVDEYVIDLNATQAAIRAGYRKHTAGSMGHELLKKPEIIAAIDAAKLARSEATKIDAAWVLKRLADEAEADLADLYDENGNLLPVEEWPLIWRQGLVAGVDIDAIYEEDSEGNRVLVGYTKKLKLSDRVKRLELIGKHIGVNAFQEQVNVKGLDTLAERLERAMRRDKGEGV